MNGGRRGLGNRLREILERTKVGPAPAAQIGRHIGSRC
jgi:hypothetical protein